jgi:hypothetical protein
MKRIVTCTAVVIVIALLLIVRAPAQAALTSALTATTPSYTGACPTTMAFTGSISGAPGTAFQYSFNRFINGTQQVVNVGAATLPSSGTLAVNDSMSITATTGANTFDQIWVHNIAGGQADVYSNRAPFSVTCGSGAPPPSGIGKFGISAMRLDPDDAAHNPAPPFRIATNGDPRACAAHMANPFVAGLLCQPIAAASKLFIMWNWEPHTGCFSCPQDVDGFKIYLTDAGMTSKTYLTQTSAGVSATVSVLDVPAGGFVGKCYSVSAYKGAKESSLGQRTCIGAEPHIGSSSSTLQPAHIRNSFSEKTAGDAESHIATHAESNSDNVNPLRAGYYYESEKRITGDYFFNRIYRAGVMFDLGSLVGRPLQKAVLHLHVSDTEFGSTIDTANLRSGSKSCAAELGTGRGAWWSNNDWIEADWVENLSLDGPTIDVDVTNPVRAWMNGAPNTGFVLRGGYENLSAFRKDQCVTIYDTASLTVDHF